MSSKHCQTNKINVDENGFLKEPEDWNEDVARILAKREGVGCIKGTKMEIIHFLRGYHKKFSSFPILGYVCKKLGKSRHCMNEEFVDPMKAWKIAGLPKPPGIFFHSFDGKHYFPNPFY